MQLYILLVSEPRKERETSNFVDAAFKVTLLAAYALASPSSFSFAVRTPSSRARTEPTLVRRDELHVTLVYSIYNVHMRGYERVEREKAMRMLAAVRMPIAPEDTQSFAQARQSRGRQAEILANEVRAYLRERGWGTERVFTEADFLLEEGPPSMSLLKLTMSVGRAFR